MMVDHVTTLVQTETVQLDQNRLDDLFVQLGAAGAENVVCRAIEELAVRISHCERLWQKQDHAGLRKCARSLVAISDQIGMTALAAVASDVTDVIDTKDQVALAATLCRLARIADCSLTAVWDLQDLSV